MMDIQVHNRHPPRAYLESDRPREVVQERVGSLAAALEPQMMDGPSVQRETASVPIYTEISPPPRVAEVPDDDPVHCRLLDGSGWR